jgi:hypothetical protein
MNTYVICLSGQIGSGKTTASIAIANALDAPHASFGDFVRKMARLRNLDPNSRAVLADLGEKLIQELGWQKFCESALTSSGWNGTGPLVVDGIRHAQALQKIRDLVGPIPVYLIHLEMSSADRTTILTRQNGKGVEKLPVGDKHSTEAQVVFELPNLANLVLDATLSPETIASEAISFVMRAAAAGKT